MLFTDQNECAYDNGGCVHLCHNAHGGYACSCYEGFTLHRNGQDCVGMLVCLSVCLFVQKLKNCWSEINVIGTGIRCHYFYDER